MNTFKKGLFAGAAALAMSMSAQAGDINVGGVVWDPDNEFILFTNELTDFFSAGNLIETASTGVGSIVSGTGQFARINYATDNSADFCPGCDLTFEFSMTTASITSTGGANFDFTFSDLLLNIYVDPDEDYIPGDALSVTDGTLWLALSIDGLLTGDGTDIGTGSDKGEGKGNLNVDGGFAAAYFDTNGEVGGTDFSFTSSFQAIFDATGAPTGYLSGDFQLSGESTRVIPEPSTIALLGLGLLGFAGARRRKA